MTDRPRSLDEAVQRIARALADDDGSGWWGEEECGPGHVDAARRLAEAAGVSVLLERLEEVERERDDIARERQARTAELARQLIDDSNGDVAEFLAFAAAGCEQSERRAESAEARVASLERRANEIAGWLERDRREPDKVLCHVLSLRRLAQGAAAPLRTCPECGQTGSGSHCHHWDVAGKRSVSTEAAAPLPGDTG